MKRSIIAAVFFIFLSSFGKLNRNDNLLSASNVNNEDIRIINHNINSIISLTLKIKNHLEPLQFKAKLESSLLTREDINYLNRNIVDDDDISRFLPLKINNDVELKKYITNSENSFNKLSLKMFNLLDVSADFKKDKKEIHKIDNSDASSVSKGAFSLGKSIVKGIWSGGRTLMSSGFLFDYKKDYNKLKATYSKTKLTSLIYVMNYMSVRNIFEDQYNSKQSKLIASGKSVWSINLLPKQVSNKVDLEESLDLYKKLKLESNRVVKVLLYNKMKGINCSKQINNQVKDLVSFWNSKQKSYDNDVDLFEDYFEALSDLKANILQRKKDIKASKESYNEKIISDLNNFVAIYNVAILQNINDLNIYVRIPAAEIEIKKNIKKGSDIYFE
jgi:hypothetical protein